MVLPSKTTRKILRHPARFALRTVKSFNRNQGLLLAGAVAYYALLSILPLLILSVIALSRFISEDEVLYTIGRYLEWLVPSQSQAVLVDISGFLKNRLATGSILLAAMIFFSSLAFSVAEKAMAVIFPHRNAQQKRHPLVSAALPFVFAGFLGVGLLGVTVASVVIEHLAGESINIFGYAWSLRGVSRVLLYLLGFSMEVVFVAALYIVLPVGAMRIHHALIGGFVAAVLWEIVRHLLFWYFSTVSMASVLYGSLTTAVVALFSFEIGATLVLFGAQVISEYEQMERE